MDITVYKHSKYDMFYLMNKEKFPQTTLSWQEYETFNEIYQWAKDNCIKGKKTNSGGIASINTFKFPSSFEELCIMNDLMGNKYEN